MIDYNKYDNTKPKHISIHRTIQKGTTKRKIKITKENKRFLKLIGLRK